MIRNGDGSGKQQDMFLSQYYLSLVAGNLVLGVSNQASLKPQPNKVARGLTFPIKKQELCGENLNFFSEAWSGIRIW